MRSLTNEALDHEPIDLEASPTRFNCIRFGRMSERWSRVKVINSRSFSLPTRCRIVACPDRTVKHVGIKSIYPSRN